MSVSRPILALALAVAVAVAGSGMAAQDPSGPTTDDLNRQQTRDPIGDILRDTAPPQEAAPPVAAPAPAVTPDPAEDEAEADEDADAEKIVVAKTNAPDRPAGKRQRRPVAVIRAIDKITAEAMTFEVRVGGPPVRYNGLIFTARACELSASDEPVEDAVAYLEVRAQPRAAQGAAPSRQVFRGWMYASSPAVSGLEHPIYDAWVVNCKA